MKTTLLADGSSDRALVPLLRWALGQAKYPHARVVLADLRGTQPPVTELGARIKRAVALEPCDLLFVHRDAERISLAERTTEVDEALLEADLAGVPVVPVRMTEAWLLIDEMALRKAAGNPAGAERLILPNLKKLELLPNPKETLHELLIAASGLTGRKRDRFHVNKAVHLLADLISDFSPLRQLHGFRQFEARLVEALRSQSPHR